MRDKKVYAAKEMFFTHGVGRHKEKLTSFELALRDADIAPYNWVAVSSIYPPGCKTISREKGIEKIKHGQVVNCVLARAETNEPGRLIAASIGLAVPKKRNDYGYLSEHHSYGETDERAGEYTEDLAATMLATTLGIEFDAEKAWKEREQAYRASGQIITTRNVTQSAVGDKRGRWTTVIAAGVFIPPDVDRLAEYVRDIKLYIDVLREEGVTSEDFRTYVKHMKRQ